MPGRSQAAWSHNLRNFKYDSDSDSQTSTPSSTQEKLTEILSEDAKLLKALDLSSRQDEAVYKPNPWTIAKLNAATRAVSSDATKVGPSAEAVQKKKEPRGSIVDGLKKQAARTVPQTSRKVLKPPPFSRTPRTNTQHQAALATQEVVATSAGLLQSSPSNVCPHIEPKFLSEQATTVTACEHKDADPAVSDTFSDLSGEYDAHICDSGSIFPTVEHGLSISVDQSLADDAYWGAEQEHTTRPESRTYFLEPERHSDPSTFANSPCIASDLDTLTQFCPIRHIHTAAFHRPTTILELLHLAVLVYATVVLRVRIASPQDHSRAQLEEAFATTL